MKRMLCLIMHLLAAAAAPAYPQSETEGSAAQALRARAAEAPDLIFPRDAIPMTVLSTPRMALYKPEGAGPFPALVLLHQCGGLANAKWQNESMLNWAKQAVARNYVVLMVDALGPRKVDSVCMGANGGVTLPRGVKDALQAAQHLRALAFVDPNRIAIAGYSWGAMAAILVSSAAISGALLPKVRFAAAVSFYPGCWTLKTAAGGAFEIVRGDINRPLLVLMGEADNETPPSECVPRLEAAKKLGAPVDWHVYPQTTHCWDCRNLDGATKVDVRGSTVTYRYSPVNTEDASQRMFQFLEKSMPARP